MDIIQMLLKEFQEEAEKTRKMLAIVPSNNWDWQPHEKSMNLKALSSHIADLPSWPALGLNSNQLDFATMDWTPPVVETAQDLVDLHTKAYEKGKAALEKASPSDLEPDWTLRNGEQILSVTSVGEMIRMSFNQTVHHRAQLGVYLRLLNVPIPGTYGPSADDGNFS